MQSQTIPRFGIIIRAPAKVASVPGNRDDVVSSYVRYRIREWRDSGRELQELARVAGLSKSQPSMTLLGTGIGGKTAPKYAAAFGFSDVDAMKSAAWEWWTAQGRQGKEAADNMSEAAGVAVDMLVELNQGTRPQIEAILAAYTHERFRGRDVEWWLQVLSAELARDRLTAKTDAKLRAQISAKQRETRDLIQRNRPPSKRPKASKRKAS